MSLRSRLAEPGQAEVPGDVEGERHLRSTGARSHRGAGAGVRRNADLATKSDLRETESRLECRVREAELRLEAKIEASRTEIIKWFVTSLFAQAAVIVKLLP